MKAERFDIHQHITDQIIAVIEQGAGEFSLPLVSRPGAPTPIGIVSRGVRLPEGGHFAAPLYTSASAFESLGEAARPQC